MRLAVLIAALLLAGCNPPGVSWTRPFDVSQQARRVVAPATATAGQPVVLTVEVEQGSCDDIRLEAAVDEAARTVTLSGRNAAPDAPAGLCSTGGVLRQVQATFTPAGAGTWVVKGARTEATIEVRP